jgi:pilus assembly protein FimV
VLKITPSCGAGGQIRALFHASREKFIYNGVLSNASHIEMTEAPQHSAWRKSQTPRLAGSLLAGFLIIVLSTSSDAAVLGDVIGVSAVGQPLRTEIRSPGSASEAAAQCLRFPTTVDNDGIPSVRDVRATIVEPGANARIIVTTRTPVMEPVVRLTIENICESRLRREYVLLLSEPVQAPATASPPPRARTTATPAPRPATDATARGPGGMRWVTAAGESPHSLAAALYPNDEGARQAFIAGVLKGNPDLFPDGRGAATPLPPGTELQIPNLARVAAASSRADSVRQRPASPAPGASPTPETRAGVPSERQGPDRLVVEGETDGAPAGSSVPNAPISDELLAREERLIAAIDRTINMQIELVERIRRLEEIQMAMRAQLEASSLAMAAASSSTATSPAAPAIPRAATPTPPARGIDPIPEREPPPVTGKSGDWWLLVVALGLIAMAVILWRRAARGRNEPRPVRLHQPSAPATGMWPKEAPTSIGERAARADEASGGVPVESRTGAAATLEWDGAIGSSASEEAETLAPIAEGDEVVEEHDSAVELADIMVSFGRLHGAAETLADFIRSNPRQAVTPWLKLMEVYRAADMRPEFDALARQLNKTFNVKAVTWENFEQARRHGGSLEALPHILHQLTKLWGTRDCQAYIENIVRDNRDGTRQGFPLDVVDDLLTLSLVLEEQLGRYRPAEAA